MAPHGMRLRLTRPSGSVNFERMPPQTDDQPDRGRSDGATPQRPLEEAASRLRSSAAARNRRASPSEKRRLRILEAAAYLFAEHGFSRTRVDQISERAGVSKGLVYVHFPSKEALFEAVLSLAIIDWMTSAVEGSGNADIPVHERLARVIRISTEYAGRNALLNALLAQDPDGLLPPEIERSDQLREAYVGAMTRLLRLGLRRGELRSDLDPAATARALWIAHSGLIRESFVGPDPIARSRPEKMAEAMIDLILVGIRPPAGVD